MRIDPHALLIAVALLASIAALGAGHAASGWMTRHNAAQLAAGQ